MGIGNIGCVNTRCKRRYPRSGQYPKGTVKVRRGSGLSDSHFSLLAETPMLPRKKGKWFWSGPDTLLYGRGVSVLFIYGTHQKFFSPCFLFIFPKFQNRCGGRQNFKIGAKFHQNFKPNARLEGIHASARVAMPRTNAVLRTNCLRGTRTPADSLRERTNQLVPVA